jgi:hypothetical protein
MGHYPVVGIVVVAVVVEDVVVVGIHYGPVVELQVVARQFGVFEQKGQLGDGFRVDPEILRDSVPVALEVP